jgi:hypothetical protein
MEPAREAWDHLHRSVGEQVREVPVRLGSLRAAARSSPRSGEDSRSPDDADADPAERLDMHGPDEPAHDGGADVAVSRHGTDGLLCVHR